MRRWEARRLNRNELLSTNYQTTIDYTIRLPGHQQRVASKARVAVSLRFRRQQMIIRAALVTGAGRGRSG